MKYSDYYIWLKSLVDDCRHDKLLLYLYKQPYRWQFELDSNRAAGGLNLRNKFAYESGVDPQDVGDGPCSILEMLIALNDRMTEFVCSDIYEWFWALIHNLKLDQFDDQHFDENGINKILNVWLDRKYDANGNGSLFPVELYLGDVRALDTWGQMNVWISEKFPHDSNWIDD